MTKCFKMVTLEALLEADALATGCRCETSRCGRMRILRRSPELLADVADDERVAELDAAAREALARVLAQESDRGLDRGEEGAAAPGSGSTAIVSCPTFSISTPPRGALRAR